MSTSEEFNRATNAYRAAIELRKLASDQVHSRLSAMLTANTIIVAVTGLAITRPGKNSVTSDRGTKWRWINSLPGMGFFCFSRSPIRKLLPPKDPGI